MKRFLCVLLAVACLCSFSVASAASLGGMLDSLSGMFGGSDGEGETDELPKLDGDFTGELTTVTIAGKKVQVHQDLIDALTVYEAFFDEYIEIITDDDVDLVKYSAFMVKYTQAMEAIDSIDEKKLSGGDDIYYLDVLTRINQKLLVAVQ